jgi:chromosomal replication initiator protein
LVLKLAAATEFGTVGDSESMPRVEDESSAAKSVCRHVAAAVARHFDLTATELKGKSRRQAVAEARSLAMYIARRLTKASYAELGRHFGGRDHTTVLHACRKVAREVGLDETTRRIADDLTIQIAAKGVT